MQGRSDIYLSTVSELNFVFRVIELAVLRTINWESSYPAVLNISY
jgi:hypothetical protein